MKLDALLTLLGLEYEELWPLTPNERLQEKSKCLRQRLERCYGRLVRRSRRIERLRHKTKERANRPGVALDATRLRLERQELLYQADLAEVIRLRQQVRRLAAAARTPETEAGEPLR